MLQPAMRVSLGLLATLAIVVLAGCTGEPAADVAVGGEEQDLDSNQYVTASEGAIEGVVLADDLLPIPGATVTVFRTSAELISQSTTSNAGRFIFGPLPPAPYVVSVMARGYGNASTLQEVRADEVTQVRLLLATVASENAYIDLQIQAGILACGFAGVVESFSCYTSATEPVLGDEVFSILYRIPAQHRATIVETAWLQDGQTMHNWFWGPYDEALLVQPWLGDAVGTSPLRKIFFPEKQTSSVRPFPGEHASYPSSDATFQLQVQTYYDGYLQREANDTAGSVCAASPRLGYCSGVGFASGFRFTQYVTNFVMQRPADLDVYSAVPDA